MSVPELKTEDYLFMRYKALVVQLEDVCKDYYHNITKKVMNERACKQEFPFPCFRLDKSQKSPYFVHISELAVCINQRHETAKKDYATFHR